MSNAALAITTNALPWGRVGSWYSARLAQNGGGVPPLLWSLVAGSLPAGLTLSPSGVISGMPSAMTVNTPFTVFVADSAFSQDVHSVYLDIVGPLVDPTNPNAKFSNGDYFLGA